MAAELVRHRAPDDARRYVPRLVALLDDPSAGGAPAGRRLAGGPGREDVGGEGPDAAAALARLLVRPRRGLPALTRARGWARRGEVRACLPVRHRIMRIVIKMSHATQGRPAPSDDETPDGKAERRRPR